MAFDVTSLQTAIAEGRVNETEGLQLLNQFYNWELSVAKLLTPKAEVAPEPAAEEAQAEVVETAPVEGEQPAEQPAE